MTLSPLTAIFLLAILGMAGWMLYRMLENVQDGLNGLTLEASLAKRDAEKRLSRPGAARALRNGASKPDGKPYPFRAMHDAHLQGGTGGLRHSVAGTGDRDSASPVFHYPKVVYKCPFMIGREGANPHASRFGSRFGDLRTEKAG